MKLTSVRAIDSHYYIQEVRAVSDERVRAVRPTYLPGRDEYEERIADRVKATGLPHCFICGRTITACDEKSAELGFDECEWLADK